MNPYWDEKLVKLVATWKAYYDLDTIVGMSDLVTRRPAFRFFRRVVFVDCPEFDDFYLKVYVDRDGFPERAEIHTY